MYSMTFRSFDLLKLNAPYPSCQANPLRFGNDSCTHRDEVDLTILTKSAIEIVEGNEE